MTPERAKGAAAPWIPVLIATFGMQVAISIAGQALPVAAPLVTSEAGLAPETVGYLVSAMHAGTVLYLLVGGPVIPRFGAVRVLQAGAAAAAIALLLSASGLVPALFLGAFLLGLGNGPTAPAGTRVLARAVPPRHRTLVFSVKQAGAPLGGFVAGLLLPPVALALGWEAALLLAAAMVCVAPPLVQRLRPALDADRNPALRIGPRALLARRNVVSPFAALASHTALLPLCALSVSLGAVQGCLLAFTVSFLVTAHGFPLGEAGLVFAALQVGGFLGRFVLAWLADRTRAPILVVLAMLAVAAAAVLAFALLAGTAPLATIVLVALLMGTCGLGWQGIVLAEFARLAPPERLSDATSGVVLLAFASYVFAPLLFAALVARTGSWSLPVILVAAQAALATLLLAPRLLREARADPIAARD